VALTALPTVTATADAEAIPTETAIPAAAADEFFEPTATARLRDDRMGTREASLEPDLIATATIAPTVAPAPTATIPAAPEETAVETATPVTSPSLEPTDLTTPLASPVAVATETATATPEPDSTPEVTPTAAAVSTVEPTATPVVSQGPAGTPVLPVETATEAPSPRREETEDSTLPAVTLIATAETPNATLIPEPSVLPEASATVIATSEPTPIETAVATTQGALVATTRPFMPSSEPADAVIFEAMAAIPESMPISPDPGTAPNSSAPPIATVIGAAARLALPPETAVVPPSASPEATEPKGSASSTTGLASSPVVATAPPVARETATPVSGEAIAVEAMTSDHEVTPGQPNHYRFQLTNTVGSAVVIQPTAVNSLAGWTGVVLQEDGATTLTAPLTIGPWQSEIVVVAVTVPADARVGDRNTISLRLRPASAEQPAEWGDFPQIEAARERFRQARIERWQYRRRRERTSSRTRCGAGASGESVRGAACGAMSSIVANGRRPHEPKFITRLSRPAQNADIEASNGRLGHAIDVPHGEERHRFWIAPN
jgi:hypothetical protein